MKSATETVDAPDKLYRLDPPTRDLLVESAPLMARWSRTECQAKTGGGMEEWEKTHGGAPAGPAASCDWYHGTWQYLRLLNMVATPPWYAFYGKALSSYLRKRPRASVLISAAADYGMLATLHEAVLRAEARPRITIYDVCETPLHACRWYAERHGLEVTCVRDNIITSPTMPVGAFDLIVTDEFLTVLKAEDKPLIARRWAQLLTPGGTVVTTAMVGGVTTAALRAAYAARARRALDEQAETFRRMPVTRDELVARFDRFATAHTRHMVSGEAEVRRLLGDFYLAFCVSTETPGECVNPTHSFQIIASIPYARPA